MKRSRYLQGLILLGVLMYAGLPHRSALANDLRQVQAFCASRSINVYQFNACMNIMLQPLRQQGGGGGYWDPNRREFHPCDNPLVPSSMC